MRNNKPYDPAKRARCVNVYWRRGRRVRILHDAFGYGGKLGTITSIGPKRVYVRIKLGKTVWDWDEVSYLPEHLRLT